MKKWRDWLRGSGPPAPFELPIDLTSAAFFEDPAPTYAWLRDHHPVAPTQQGGFVVSRHADVVAALSNPVYGNAPSRFSVLSGHNSDKYAAAALARNIPPFQDAPGHVATRQAVSSAFYAAIGSAREWIPEEARGCVTRHTGQTVDLVADIARPFACATMARFVGLTLDAGQIKEATQSFFHVFAPITDQAAFTAANADIATARQCILAHVDERAEDSLIAALRKADMTDEQIADNAYLVLADGIENIEAAVAMCFDILCNQQVDWQDDTVLDAAVLECLRLSSPAQIIPRVLREETHLMGEMRPAGVPVFLALGAANLDPDAYPDPQVFRLDRDTAPLLVFGQGRHSCIGQQLAMLQIRSLVRALFESGVEGATGQDRHWIERFGHRWPQRMAARVPS